MRRTAWVLAALLIGTTAFAQKARMDKYQDELEERIEELVDETKTDFVVEQTPDLTRDELRDLTEEEWKSVVSVHESKDGEGQDVELRFTMPVDAFMEIAPRAALEAAAVPHAFPVVYIYLREQTTGRVGRVAFRDAEPIAKRYLAGEKEEAIEDMEEAIIWH